MRTSVLRSAVGFTIIELLVSVAILGILASVAMPVVQTTVTREKEYQLRIALRDIRNAIDAYKTAATTLHIAPPDGESAQAWSGYPPNLSALSAGVQDLQNPTGPLLYFIRSIPADPFFPDQTAPAINTWAQRSFESDPDTFVSPPATPADVFDVQSMSTATGLNGVAYSKW